MGFGAAGLGLKTKVMCLRCKAMAGGGGEDRKAVSPRTAFSALKATSGAGGATDFKFLKTRSSVPSRSRKMAVVNHLMY